ECRWGVGGLRQVENSHSLPYGDGGAVEVDGLQEAIHFAGADAFLAFGGDFLDQGEDFVDILSSGGRNEKHGCVVQELQGPSQAFEVYLLILRPLGILNSGGSRLADGPTLSRRRQAPLVHEGDR